MANRFPVEILESIAGRIQCLADFMELCCSSKQIYSSLISSSQPISMIFWSVACNRLPKETSNPQKVATDVFHQALRRAKSLPENVFDYLLVQMIPRRATIDAILILNLLIKRNAVETLQNVIKAGLDLSSTYLHAELLQPVVTDPSKIELLKLLIPLIPPSVDPNLVTAIRHNNVPAVYLLMDYFARVGFSTDEIDKLVAQTLHPSTKFTIFELLIYAYTSTATLEQSSNAHVLSAHRLRRARVLGWVNHLARNDGGMDLCNFVKNESDSLADVLWLLNDVGVTPTKQEFEHAVWLAAAYNKVDMLKEFLKRGVSPNACRALTSSGVPELKKMYMQRANERAKAFRWRFRRDKRRQYFERLSILPPRYMNTAVGDTIPCPPAHQQDQFTLDTALSQAAARGHVEVVRLLVDAGCDASKDWAVALAAMNGHFEIVDFLKSHLNPDAQLERLGRLVHAVDCGNVDDVRKYMGVRKKDMIKHSFVKGSQNFKLAKHYFEEAFIHACKTGKTEITDIFIEAGVDLRARNNEALRCAVHEGHLETVRMLVDAGVDVNIGSPLLLVVAALGEHLEIAQLLVSKNARALRKKDSIEERHRLNYILFESFICQVLEQGNIDIIMLLLDQQDVRDGIKFDAAYFSLFKAFDAAFASNKLCVVRLLLNIEIDLEHLHLWSIFVEAAEHDKRLASIRHTTPHLMPETDWSPQHGFLFELIHHKKRNHTKIIQSLVNVGAVNVAISWGLKHDASTDWVHALIEKEYSEASPRSKACDEDYIKELARYTKYETLVEYAVLKKSPEFLRALQKAGEPLAHGASLAFARAIGSKRVIHRQTSALRLLSVPELDVYDGIRVLCYLGELALLKELVEMQGIRVGFNGGGRLSQADSAVNLPGGAASKMIRPSYVEVPGAVLAAVRGKHVEALKYLLRDCRLGADDVTPDGQTALLIATQLNQRDCVSLLLSYGASAVRARYAALWAVRGGDVETLTLLLKCGASPHGPTSEEMAEMVRTGEAKPQLQFLNHRSTGSGSFDSSTVLGLVGTEAFDDETKWGFTLQERMTPLVNATQRGSTKMIQLLLQHGADANACDGMAMSVAIRRKGATRTAVLRQAGASAMSEFRGLLMVHIENGDEKGVQEVLELANITTNIETLLDSDSVVTRLSKETSSTPNPLLSLGEGEAIRFACFHGRPNILKMLLKEPGARVDWCDHEALILAAHKNSAECVSLLLSHGADPNARNTEVLFALIGGGGSMEDTLRVLLRGGADVNARGRLVWTMVVTRRVKWILRKAAMKLL